MTIHRKRTSCLMALVVVFSLFTFPGSVWACEDSLMNLLSAEDPVGAYYLNLMVVDRFVTQLVTAIQSHQAAQYESLLQTLMEGWLAFASKYGVNPPEGAKNVDWNSEMRQIGEAIGGIRKGIAGFEEAAALQAGASLTVGIKRMYNIAPLGESKRTYLLAGEMLKEMMRIHQNGKLVEMLPCIASISKVMESVTPSLGTESQALAASFTQNLGTLEKMCREPVTVATFGKIDQAMELTMKSYAAFFAGVFSLKLPAPEGTNSASNTGGIQ